MQSSWFFGWLSDALVHTPRCTFDFYELRKLALCSQVNSCISFVTICWAKHVFSCRLNSIYFAVCVCLHLIYFTLCDIRARARHKTAQCYYFCYAAVIRSLCVQFMSFSNFAFCTKLTKIYSCDTTGQNAKFFSSFSVPRALCHFILWNACLR